MNTTKIISNDNIQLAADSGLSRVLEMPLVANHQYLLIGSVDLESNDYPNQLIGCGFLQHDNAEYYQRRGLIYARGISINGGGLNIVNHVTCYKDSNIPLIVYNYIKQDVVYRCSIIRITLK